MPGRGVIGRCGPPLTCEWTPAPCCGSQGVALVKGPTMLCSHPHHAAAVGEEQTRINHPNHRKPRKKKSFQSESAEGGAAESYRLQPHRQGGTKLLSKQLGFPPLHRMQTKKPLFCLCGKHGGKLLQTQQESCKIDSDRTTVLFSVESCRTVSKGEI